MPATYRVYVLQIRSRKFYVGVSDDVAHRIEQHNMGVSRWTRGKGTLEASLGKRTNEFFEGSQTCASAEEAKGRRWVLPIDRLAGPRRIILRLQDREFKSRPQPNSRSHTIAFSRSRVSCFSWQKKLRINRLPRKF
jgi:predicted GIY-YIG superfamily endonuclease